MSRSTSSAYHCQQERSMQWYFVAALLTLLTSSQVPPQALASIFSFPLSLFCSFSLDCAQRTPQIHVRFIACHNFRGLRNPQLNIETDLPINRSKFSWFLFGIVSKDLLFPLYFASVRGDFFWRIW